MPREEQEKVIGSTMPIRTINKSSVHDFSGMAFAMVHDHWLQRYCPLGLSAIGT